jgi:peptidoglycan hydrolase CwlO-like protein
MCENRNANVSNKQNNRKKENDNSFNHGTKVKKELQQTKKGISKRNPFSLS